MKDRDDPITDHTTGLGTKPVGALLWNAGSQATISVATFGIYALTNAWFVSRGVNEIAFAAVNIVAPVLLILGAVSTTVGIGGASLVSRSLGLGDRHQAARATGNAFCMFWIAAIVVGGLGIMFLDPLLKLLGATSETLGYAHDYAIIILAGSITATGFSSLVRAEGRMRFSTMMWIAPVTCQIILDPLFIFIFKMGVAGAAWGTIGGQAVSMLMGLWFFFAQRNRPYRIRLADVRPHGPTLRQLITVGAPSFLGGFGNTVVIALVNNILVSLGGPMVLSAYAICSRIGTFVLMPQLGISQGMQPIVGYNSGRRLLDRVNRTRTLAMRATFSYGVGISLLVLLLAGQIASIFTSDQAILDIATPALRIIALSYPLAGVVTLVSSYFQAIGQARPSYVISVGAIVVVRIPLLLVFSSFGMTWLWISFPVAELIIAAVSLLILRRLTPIFDSKMAPADKAP